MDFSSDTSAPAHPRVMEALARVNAGHQSSYGNDAVTAELRGLLARTLEIEDFDFWLCASGTASNALALSCFCPPTGAILCHAEAHIARDERGAPEFFSGGGKLQLLGGDGAQIEETELRDALARIDHGFVHETPAHVLSLTNLTESGTAYPAARIAHYAALAKEAGLTVHLDGARIANALVSMGASLADMSWRAGTDVLCLGLTKTGAMGCEIIVLFGEARTKFNELKARAKRSGHMPPKMRYLAAQAIALLTDGLWLDLARNANQRAQEVANLLCRRPGTELVHPVHGNEVFVRLDDETAGRLRDAGAVFYTWLDGSSRLVTSWQTGADTIDQLASVLD
ncbi:threonine aldolase family protein [Henriciella pelagia]|jgi:threonine aldolase|uniref:L-threonine aldolase n=1 Tax=Henriciella pelagia TaxID=1977912 RepID=A0ABQ1JPL3_9PROT|nr:beta-eliminating lyase-related protein [Henriciella pelagia]GGB74319.1 L-threonine aldolase [Henriciella pelagia]